MAFFGKDKSDRAYEVLGVIMLAVTVLLFCALVSDRYQISNAAGDGRRPITDLGQVYNLFGTPGAYIATFLYILVGHGAHVFYFMTGLWGIMLLRHRPVDRLPTRVAGFLILLGGVAGLLHVDLQPASGGLAGGVVGAFVASLVEPTFTKVGANVIGVTMCIIGLLLSTEFLFVHILNTIKNALVLMVKAVLHFAATSHQAMLEYQASRETRAESKETARAEKETRRAARRRKRAEKTAQQNDAPTEAVTADLSRINIQTQATPVPSIEAELPFDKVPDFDQESVRADPEQLVLPEEPLPEAPGAVASDVGKGDKSLPRRKTKYDDELPPDYVYPKRYTKPPIDIFEEPPVVSEPAHLSERLRETSVLLEDTLKTFGIEARVTDVTRGPTITRYELEPAPGIKVSRFSALADDLALALKAHRVRVEAPIPGKGRVGIEVPNKDRESVVVRELLESNCFKRSKGQLNLALGKDISGHVMTADMATMPHLLVAGATGAGKTVCVKTLLASLLYEKPPEELQLMLIDPKMVELSIFNDIPHLITPVVIDPKKAATALNWLIVEMEERYRLFAHLRVRNIEVYNESVENGEIEMPPSEEGEEEGESVNVVRKLPYIVCIIDELADLMMLARSEVEDAIGRLAQLARAVGIHLIIATQRPSVDVLTGVIKANFPSRISFQVSSRVDSRCILDEIGAERLIGMGDMLYLPPGHSKPTRVQGAFVSDEEMNQLIAYLKTQAPPQYRDEIENFGKQQGALEDIADEEDDMLDDAIQVVLDTGQASISMVQRKLRVGYTRAARLIDMMEAKGIVGPHVGSKAREILVDSPPKDEVA